MKSVILKSIVALAVVVMFILSSFDTKAQVKFSSDKIRVKALKSLAIGIKSDNDGLKKNSIYFAGKYKIDEMVKPLTEQLRRENDPSTRVLIALSLYQIGKIEGIQAIMDLAKNDKNEHVKSMSNAIISEILKNPSSVAER